MSIFNESERNFLSSIEGDIFIESSKPERKKVLDLTINELKKLGLTPNIDKKSKIGWINENNSGDFEESLCICLEKQNGYSGLSKICAEVNKVIKPYNAKLSPDNYGTVFLSMMDDEDSVVTESYTGNYFWNKILLFKLGKNPEVNREGFIKIIKKLNVKYKESLNNPEVIELKKKKDVSDYFYPIIDMSFPDGKKITLSFCYDDKSFTPGAAIKLEDKKYAVLLYPNFFEEELESQIFIALHEIGHIRLGHCEGRNASINPNRRANVMINGGVAYPELNADLYATLNGAKMYTILNEVINKDRDNHYDYRYTNNEMAKRYSYVFKKFRKMRGFKESTEDYSFESTESDLNEKILKDLTHYVKWCRLDDSLFYNVNPLKHPIVHKSNKLGRLLLLATLNHSDKKSNEKLFEHLKNNVRYGDQRVDFGVCYLPGDLFLYVALDKLVKESSKSTAKTGEFEIEEEYYKKYNGKDYAYVKIKGNDKPLRGRSEVIIMKDDKIFLCFDNGNYRLPGGGWDKNESYEHAAIREAKEESRIECENLRYATTRVDFQKGVPDKCKKENIPEEGYWYGYFTKVYIGEYSKKFSGHIDEDDKDKSMVKNGDFYSYDEVKNRLYPEHKKAIEEYLKNNDYTEESAMMEGYLLNDKDIYYNKEKFDSGEINLCFITGHSGSGKSTMGETMVDKKTEHYDLDDVIWNKMRFTMEQIKEYGDLIYTFFNGTGKKYWYTEEDVKSGKAKALDGWYEKDLTNDFINYAINFAKSHKNKKFVIEGIWLYMFVDPAKLKDYAVYIKGTSATISTIRAAKRDSKFDFPDKKDSLKRVKSFFSRLGVLFRGGVGSEDSGLFHERLVKDFRKYFENHETDSYVKESEYLFLEDSADDDSFEGLELFLESAEDSHIIRDEIYPSIEEVLKTNEGDKMFKKLVEDFVNRNTSKLYEPCPISMIAFTDADKARFFDLFNFNEKDLIKIVSRAVDSVSGKAQFRLVKQNPIFSVFYCVLRYYILKNDMSGINTTLIIHALSSYPSVFSKYFKYGANEGVMKYTADHLTEKFIFKQEGHVFGALRKSIESSYKFLKPYFKEAADKEVIRYIQRIRNDQNSMIKKIANEYTKNYKEGKSISTQSETYDTGSLIDDYNNDTSKVESISQKVIINLLTNGINIRTLDTAAQMAQLSVTELRLYLVKILIDSRSTELESFINSVLFIYLFDEKHETQEIRSRMFLSFGIELFRRTNSNNKNIVTIKSLLDKWATETGINARYKREPTQISYKKGIYWYLLLTIQANC